MNEDYDSNQQAGNFVDQNSAPLQQPAAPNIPPAQSVGPEINTQSIEQPQPKKSSKKIWLTIVIVLIILGLLGYFYGPRAYLIYKAKYTLFSPDKTPGAYVVPESHTLDTSLKPAATYDIKIANLTITAPWAGPPTIRGNEVLGSYDFGGSKKIVIMKDEENVSVQGVVNEEKGKYIKDSLGADKFSTAYASTETMQNLSPDNLSITENTNKLAAEITLLTIKSAISLNADKIYSYSSGDFKIFQYGSAGGAEAFTIALYDKQGRHIYDISFKEVNQQEIDYIVKSIKTS